MRHLDHLSKGERLDVQFGVPLTDPGAPIAGPQSPTLQRFSAAAIRVLTAEGPDRAAEPAIPQQTHTIGPDGPEAVAA